MSILPGGRVVCVDPSYPTRPYFGCKSNGMGLHGAWLYWSFEPPEDGKVGKTWTTKTEKNTSPARTAVIKLHDNGFFYCRCCCCFVCFLPGISSKVQQKLRMIPWRKWGHKCVSVCNTNNSPLPASNKFHPFWGWDEVSLGFMFFLFSDRSVKSPSTWSNADRHYCPEWTSVYWTTIKKGASRV